MGDVTIVVPFWNLDEAILRECVESLQAQCEACTILVVDNASDTPVAQLPGTDILRLEQRVSVGKARNLGLQQVQTPFVMFMDADDVLLPDAVPALLRLMRAHPGASLAAGGIDDWICETKFRAPKNWPGPLAHRLTRFPKVFRAANVVRNMTPVTGCAVIDTAMAKTTAGFPDCTAEDWVFGALMSFRGPVVLTKDKVKLYRWRAEGLSKLAVYDLKALWEARCVTREAVASDPCVPLWLKAAMPLVRVLHAFELPFHIRRERRFSDMRQIGAHDIPAPAEAVMVEPPVQLLNLRNSGSGRGSGAQEPLLQ